MSEAQGIAEPAAQRPSRLSGLFGGIGCLLIIGLLALLVVGGYALSQFGERLFASPGDIVDRYTSAARNDDARAAYEILCTDLRSRWTEADLRSEMDRQQEGIGTIASIEHGSLGTIPRGLDRFSVYRTFRGTLSSRTVEFTVVRESEWRICDFQW